MGNPGMINDLPGSLSILCHFVLMSGTNGFFASRSIGLANQEMKGSLEPKPNAGTAGGF